MKMRNTGKNKSGILILLLVIAFLIYGKECIAQDDNPFVIPDAQTHEEAIFEFRYTNYISGSIIVYYYKGEIYLPFDELITKLKIFHTTDFENKIYEGYFIQKDSTFTIDFIKGQAKYRDSLIYFEENEFLMAALDVYVLPSVFKKVFDLDFDVSMNNLKINLNSMVELPILTEIKRKLTYSFLNQDRKSMAEKELPLLFDRNFMFLNGGVLQYNLQYSKGGHYSYGTTTGLEILGGDMTLNLNGSYSVETKISDYNYNYRWRYFISDNPYLSQIYVGQLSGGGFRTSNLSMPAFTGIQITNEQTKLPTFFSDFTFEDQIDPFWEVELYQNGQLVDHQVSDEQGYYKFILPVDYGQSNIEIRYYGPNGEYEAKQEVINIPTQFLRPGEIRYAIGAGQMPSMEKELFEYAGGSLNFGLTHWMSNTSSISYNIYSKKIDVATSLSFKAADNIFSSINFVPEQYTDLNTNMWFTEFGSYSISWKRYLNNSQSYKTGMRHQFRLRTTLPRLANLPFNLSINATRNQTVGISSNMVTANMSMNLRPINLSSYYTISFTQDKENKIDNIFQMISTNLMYSIPWMNKLSEHLGPASISLGTGYNITNNQFQMLTLNYGQSLSNWLSFSGGLSKSLTYSDAPISYNVGLRLNLPQFRSSTTGRGSGVGELFYTQEIEGTLGFVPSQGEFIIANPSIRSSVASSAANIRVFLDENGNEVYDSGEQLVPGINAYIPEASANRRSVGGMLQFYNLIPYNRYNVYIRTDQIKNPLWIPEFTEFSFIADPNVYKPIDIPCYAGAVIEGRVAKVVKDSAYEQAGVKVHVMKSDSSFYQQIPVFSDGSFYFMGVPPGEYTAWVDSTQLAILDLEYPEKVKDFKVEKTTEGTFVEGLDFDLFLKGAKVYDVAQKEDDDIPGDLVVPDSLKDEMKEEVEASIEQKESGHAENIPQEVKVSAKEDSLAAIIIPNEPKLLFYNKAKDYKITDEMKEYLEMVIAYMKIHQDAELAIIGHTDNFGSLDATMEKSKQRANEISEYLQNKGIEKYRLFPRGQGSLSPISRNTTPEGRRANRRVEIKVIRK